MGCLPGVDAAGDAGDGLVVGGHAGRVGGVEGAAHPVVDRPLLGDGEGGGVGGVGGVGFLDEGPGGGVDEGLVVGLGHGGSPLAGSVGAGVGEGKGLGRAARGAWGGVRDFKGLAVGVRVVLRIGGGRQIMQYSGEREDAH